MLKPGRNTGLILTAVLAAASCGDDGGLPVSPPPPGDAWLDDPDETFSGGAATSFETGKRAFAQPVPRLSALHEDEFFVGNALFNRGWVIAPASVSGMDGLGPVFNATNCSACHQRDGRGQPPERPEDPFLSMLIRLSVPGAGEHGEPLPEPRYGGQLQGEAIPGVPAEGRARVIYEEVPGTFADGEEYSLRRPHYEIDQLGYGPLAAGVMLSPRTGPHLVGLGLLEAVPEETLLALADPDDRDGDGISGRPNLVWDSVNGRMAPGRFGWKANQPSLRQQSAGAFNGDIGITSSLFPTENCTPAETACLAAPRGAPGEEGPQLHDSNLDSVVSYVSTLAVPARRRTEEPSVKRGKIVFGELGCTGCHTPVLQTGVHPDFPELSNQKIRPFTDLLLHNLGPDLADERPDFQATGSEWRTPPLWGLGLVPAVNRHRDLLHDGRARGFAEAILWHGGEGGRSREAFRALPRADRDALVAFLDSL